MDINDLPFEEALDIYYELIHAIEADDEETIKELNLTYPSLFDEETLQSLAETAERVQRMGNRQTLPPLPETHTRKARVSIQLDRINRLVRENPRFFNDTPNTGLLYIELAVDKLESIINGNYNYDPSIKDKSGKIVLFPGTSKKKK